ncbi:MAG: hypothetical protein HOW73_49135 [Polyangiaceae bacterium]|nr:hypothetical protein [Polyangiaceae bacterium]
MNAVLFAVLAAACGSDQGCPELCAKEVQCRQDLGVMGPDEESCVAQCEGLAEDDPDFAEAVAEKASCIQDLSCDEVVFGAFECAPEG